MQPDVYEMAQIAGMHCQVLPADIFSPCRSDDLVAARATIAKVLRERGMLQREIADALNRERTTILHLLRRFEPIRAANDAVDAAYRELSSA